MSYRGVPSWRNTQTSKGEVGILKDVKYPRMNPYNRCFLIFEYNRVEYTGCLHELAFCRKLTHLLRLHCGRPIQEIAALDISHTL